MEVVKQEVNGGNPMAQKMNQNQGGGAPAGGNQKQNQNQGRQNQQGGGPNQQNRNRNRNPNQNQNQNQNQNRFGNRNQQSGGGAGQNRGPNANQDNPNDCDDERQQQQRQGNRGNRNPGRMNQGGEGGGDQVFDRRRGPGEMYFINDKLRLLQGPLLDIPPVENAGEEGKFAGRNRLYIGNLTNDVTEDELIELFRPYGDINEIFVNKEKNYAFVRVDYFSNAEKAKRELEGTTRKNRIIRVRFAPNATALRVKNLTPDISNELLFRAFEVFGPVERAVVQVDERGKSTGEGIVEYKAKPAAMAAQRHCSERCYFLNASLRPVIVEPYIYQDNNADGLPEKSLNKKIPEFHKLRQQGPHFADMGSFEHEYGQRWKHMHELFKQKAEALKREMIMEEEKLEAQMEYARYEHETEQLREQLRMREQDSDRQKAEFEMKERMAQEAKQRNEVQMKRKVEEMQTLIKRTDDELHRRQQENNIFMQHQGNMEANENRNRPFENQQGGGGGGGNGNNGGNFGGMEIRDYDHGQNRQSRFNDNGGQQNQNQGGGMQQRMGNAFGGPGGNNRNWMNNNNERRNNNEDFQNKRRRF